MQALMISSILSERVSVKASEEVTNGQCTVVQKLFQTQAGNVYNQSGVYLKFVVSPEGLKERCSKQGHLSVVHSPYPSPIGRDLSDL
ncbi:hypothetical protein V6N13_026570 [Hibiscus sabdariffa]|uniref:Uncharacterized protein n=2 Tax=Hibiscus sabdariffa TaxID=183260 RepID=A0ABR2PEI9_9ROSI